MEIKHPNYYKKLRAQARKLTSSQASEHKPSSPGSRVQASSPNGSVPRSRNQGTSKSSQA